MEGDVMKILYAPWREQYSRSTHKKKEGCVFCLSVQENIEDRFILYKGKHCYVAMNLYPYNAGHLLVIPYTHKPHLHTLDQDVRAELMELISSSADILENKIECDGLNIGLNCGKVSGGSIPDHLHFHVVPRFKGDTNFLSICADTKVISFDLGEMYARLKPYFDELKLA